MSAPGESSLPAAVLADVWRSPADPRWREAHAAVKKVFDAVAAKHPRLSAVKGADRDSVIEDLLAGFWCHLAASPATLEASRVRSAGALRVECWRYLDRSDAGIELGTPRARLLRHLQRMKVQPSLRGDDRFTPYSRNLWSLAAWTKGSAVWPRGGDRVPSDDAVREGLPPLPARLDAQKPGQIPPLVDVEQLPAFLEAALARSMRPRTDWALTRLAWDKLAPSPDGVLLGVAEKSRDDHDDDESGVAYLPAPDEAADARVAKERWARRVDVVASSLVDVLSPRQQTVALGFLLSTPQQELCDRLKISRGTLHNETIFFRDRLAAAIASHDLDEDGARILLSAVLNILEAEAFMATGEEPGP